MWRARLQLAVRLGKHQYCEVVLPVLQQWAPLFVGARPFFDLRRQWFQVCQRLCAE